MASLVLCNRTGGKCCRSKIEGVNLSGSVSEFRRMVAEKIEAPTHEIELLYCGHSLDDGKTLESYGAQSGVTIHALRKHDTDMQQDLPEKMDETVVQQVVTALQAALINPAYRSTVERMLTDPDTLENIIAATPGLDRDPVAISVLQDPELLAMLADPSNIQKVIDEHPSLGQAAMMVAAAVNEEGVKGGGGSSGPRTRSARGTYSLDQMSDDEDMEGPGPRAQLGQPTSITTSQLAAALAAAAGGSGMQAAAQPQLPTTSTPASTSAASMITADFFRQAIAAAAESSANASSSSTVSATPTQEQPPHILQAQLEQLRDMGIEDEAAARNALQVTNGNLEAAIALLFGDGGF